MTTWRYKSKITHVETRANSFRTCQPHYAPLSCEADATVASTNTDLVAWKYTQALQALVLVFRVCL